MLFRRLAKSNNWKGIHAVSILLMIYFLSHLKNGHSKDWQGDHSLGGICWGDSYLI